MNRRNFLAASMFGAAAMSPLLSACGSGGAQKTGANTETGLKAALPDYIPNTAIKPDIAPVPGAPDILTDPGFIGYPAKQISTVSGIPGKGGTYTAVTPLWGTVPPAENAFYQAMNKALGATFTMKPADGNNYKTIIPTMTAARKLPAWIQLPSWLNSNFNVGGLAGTQLADLTPYLAGDKIKKYPNLAAIPTAGWRTGVWGDKLFGIPSFTTSMAIGGVVYFRRDIFDAKGITADQVKSADDYMNLGKELTDAKAGVWAFGDVWTYLHPAWGVPYKWTVENGKLVHKYEMPQFLDALDWHNKLATNGYIHPDTLAGDQANGTTRFYAGKTLIGGDGTGSWVLSDHKSGVAATPGFRRGAFNVIAADGRSEPRLFLGNSTSWISYLNADLKPEQIEELLAIANYLAAPYGSVEYTMVNYGVEGVHYTMQDGAPAVTDAGQKEVKAVTYPFLAAPAGVLSNPGADHLTRDLAAWQAKNVKTLYKPVFWNMNFSLPQSLATADAAQPVEDAIKDCYHGRKTVKEVRDTIATWKSSGGDKLTAWMTDNVLNKVGTGQ